jgi:hypothetical protein
LRFYVVRAFFSPIFAFSRLGEADDQGRVENNSPQKFRLKSLENNLPFQELHGIHSCAWGRALSFEVVQLISRAAHERICRIRGVETGIYASSLSAVISACHVAWAEKSSADEMMRTPTSRQKSKHPAGAGGSGDQSGS